MKWWALVFLLLGACQSEPPVHRTAGVAMTIPYQILWGPGGDRDPQQIAAEVFAHVDAHFNNWNPHSEVSQINRLPEKTTHKLSEPLAHLLAMAGKLVALTEGRFDPTVGSLCSCWKEALEHQQPPSLARLKPLRAAIGWHTLRIQDGTLIKTDARTHLDLSGIAKGYAVDLLAEALNEAGFANVHVTWGGEIRASGRHPSGRRWTVGIASPTGGAPLTSLPLTDCAIATSGSYEQVWETEGGSCFTHICNPLTGEALQVTQGMVTSATVVAPSCAIADGLATALMLAVSQEEAAALIKKWEEALPDVSILVAVCDSV